MARLLWSRVVYRSARKHATVARSTVFAARFDSAARRCSASASAPVRNSHSPRCSSSAKVSSCRRSQESSDNRDRRHELTFALELHRGECEFLTGALAEAEQRLAALSNRAANTVERATVACLRADLYTTLDQSSRAIAVGLDYLRHLGIDWSPHPTEEEARHEYEGICSQLGGRAIEALIDLPLMSDAASLATLDVLTKLVAPAFYTDGNLLALIN